jgi:hypothetical protein
MEFKNLNDRQIKKIYSYLYNEIHLMPLGGDASDAGIKTIDRIPLLFNFMETYKEAEKICGKNNKDGIEEFFECIFTEIENRRYEDIISLKEGNDFGFSIARKKVFLIDENLYDLTRINPKTSKLQDLFKKFYRRAVKEKGVLMQEKEYENLADEIVSRYSGIFLSPFAHNRQIENFMKMDSNLNSIRKEYSAELNKKMNPMIFIKEEINACEQSYNALYNEKFELRKYVMLSEKSFRRDFIKKYAFIPDKSFCNYFRNRTAGRIISYEKIKKNIKETNTLDEKGRGVRSFRACAKNLDDAFRERDIQVRSHLSR